MFTILVRELTVDENEFGDDQIVKAVNTTANKIARKLSVQLKDVSCPDHEAAHQTITIIADRQEIVYINKTKFCCRDFREAIQIKTQ